MGKQGFIITSSRDPERYVHHWVLPRGLTRDQAREYFLRHVKPRNFEITRFIYDAKTGIAKTVSD
jgi:hypothetical protein